MDGHLPPPGVSAGDAVPSACGCCSSLVWNGHAAELWKIWFEIAARLVVFSFLFSNVDRMCPVFLEVPWNIGNVLLNAPGFPKAGGAVSCGIFASHS